MRRRAGTVAAPRPDLDMMVLEYCCHDESAFTALGKNCKEMRWRVAAMGTSALEIRLHVEKVPYGSPHVSIKCDDAKLWPINSSDKSVLREDFEQKWPFRGEARGLGVNDFFEVRPKGMDDQWFPAARVLQRRDGVFQADTWLPDSKGGWRTVHFPAVDKADIREAESKRPIDVPMRYVKLRVPAADPLRRTTLTLEDGDHEEDITHYFARATPSPAPHCDLESLPDSRPINFEVSKDRKLATSSATHSMLAAYMLAELRAVEKKPESKTKMSWTLQIGPFGQHVITVEKKSKSSKIATLAVDDRLLVEAATEDFDCDLDAAGTPTSASASDPIPWLCRFRFIGERSVMFKVHEQAKDGCPLDTVAVLEGLQPEQVKYEKICQVVLRDPKDLTMARLEVDGTNFDELRPLVDFREEALSITPEVLSAQYGITVPQQISHEPPKGLAAVGAKLQEGWQQAQPRLQSLGSQLQEGLQQAQPGLQSLGSKLQESVGALFGGKEASQSSSAS